MTPPNEFKDDTMSAPTAVDCTLSNKISDYNDNEEDSIDPEMAKTSEGDHPKTEGDDIYKHLMHY